MANMTPTRFVKKWSQIQLKERTSAQSHFNDICALVGHKTPLEVDPKGEFFTFEADAEKLEGEQGWADAWYKNKFIWEYKGPDKDLHRAYQQLLLYKDSLGNPPLLITSDTHIIFIHTNFTNTVKRVEKIDFERLLDGDGLELLRAAFYDPEKLKPEKTQEQVTKATADEFVAVANTLQKWAQMEGRAYSREEIAHFLVRLLFALFAEDIGLLPNRVFTELVHKQTGTNFERGLRHLFAAMRAGGVFGVEMIPHFDGGLFDSDFVPQGMPSDVVYALRAASEQDWANVDPSIFGTLFERIIDQSKRAQLGAHYTGRDDILLVVEPVLMQPLRGEWQEVKLQAAALLQDGRSDSARGLLAAFSEKIAATRVLDPACGSGNFLYIALRQLLDLQKEVITYAGRNALPELALTAGPGQIYGIETNHYAHELAQVTVWIGYLQWRAENGFAHMEEPILRPLRQIEHKDAIIDIDLTGLRDLSGLEPTWPEAEVIIGNPPFLGGKRMRSELGDKYVDALFKLYEGRVPHEADLVCYWFEKARSIIQEKKITRAGLLATNSIRGGPNRKVLERIKQTGDIFWAQSDRDWILDGAAVNVSMIGFDNGNEKNRYLDNHIVSEINPDLTASINLTKSKRLEENRNICYMGVTPAGTFTVSAKTAKEWIQAFPKNKNVLRAYLNGEDITNKSRDVWTVDFGVDMTQEEAKKYKLPFEYVEKVVKPIRAKNNRASYREKWWLFAETRSGMRAAIQSLQRYIVTPRVSKHRIFIWAPGSSLVDSATFLFARSDDYFFGILHSKPHELWSLRQGTSLEDRPRYTPTSTFETFPFPWPPGEEPKPETSEVLKTSEVYLVEAIAANAKALDDFRTDWLNSIEGQVGVTVTEKTARRYTLTNLYNALSLYREEYKGRQRDPRLWAGAAYGDILSLEQVETLDHIHTRLDASVLEAYGWPHNLSDEGILERLLALNLERAGSQ
jgi:hypothetical protein